MNRLYFCVDCHYSPFNSSIFVIEMHKVCLAMFASVIYVHGAIVCCWVLILAK